MYYAGKKNKRKAMLPRLMEYKKLLQDHRLVIQVFSDEIAAVLIWQSVDVYVSCVGMMNSA